MISPLKWKCKELKIAMIMINTDRRRILKISFVSQEWGVLKFYGFGIWSWLQLDFIWYFKWSVLIGHICHMACFILFSDWKSKMPSKLLVQTFMLTRSVLPCCIYSGIFVIHLLFLVNITASMCVSASIIKQQTNSACTPSEWINLLLPVISIEMLLSRLSEYITTEAAMHGKSWRS